MELYTTAQIEVSTDQWPAQTRANLHAIQKQLQDALESAANAVFEKNGIFNDYVHAVSVEEIEVEENGDEE